MSRERQARVSAEHSVESVSFGAMAPATPAVAVSVDFEYGDHVRALAALDRAVASVRRQVEATREAAP